MQIDAGWYGKLPTLGDFATRRFPPAFTEAWDAWLAAGLAEWKARGDGCLNEYLAGPVWRFVAAPGVLAPPGLARGWAGVIAPSLDRVEQHFPFTVAIGFAPQAVAPFATMLVHWLHHVGGITGDALRENWTPEQLDEALAELAEATDTPTGDAATHQVQIPGHRRHLGSGYFRPAARRTFLALAAFLVTDFFLGAAVCTSANEDRPPDTPPGAAVGRGRQQGQGGQGGAEGKCDLHWKTHGL